MAPAGQARGNADRPGGRAGAAAAVVAGGFGLLTVVGTVAATPGRDAGAAAERALPSVLVVLALAGPVTAAVAAWWVRNDHLHVAVGLAVAAVCTAAPLWAGWPALPDPIRAGALAVPPLAVAGLAQVPLLWSSGPRRAGALRVAYALALAAVAVHLVGYDPLADISCARTCADLAPLLGPVLPSRVAVLLAGALTLVALGVAGAAVLGPGTSAAPRSVRAAALLSSGALAIAVVVRTAASGGADLQGAVLVLLPGTVLPTAVAVAVAARRTARVRASVARVADQLALSPGRSSGRGPLLGDVHFAVGADGTRWVDGEGRDVDPCPSGSSVILRDPTGPAIRLVPRTPVDEHEVIAGLTPARRLALDNARLTAVTRAHLVDLRASQRRVVGRTDAERRRIERDLHDGVQQRLVSASLHLSAARNRTAPAGGSQLAAVDDDLRLALAALRRLSHGVFPEGLLDEGLEVALDELVRDCDREVALTTSGDLRVATGTAMAVYALVRVVLEEGNRAPGPARVRVDVTGDGLTAVVEAPASPDRSTSEALQAVADRVGAEGGALESRTADRRTTVTAVIPCAS